MRDTMSRALDEFRSVADATLWMSPSSPSMAPAPLPVSASGRMQSTLNQRTLGMVVESLESPVTLVDHASVDWERVRRTSYLVDQVLRYEYPGPVENLHQRLVVFPHDRYGQQRLLNRHLQVSGPQPRLQEELDQFGNRVCHLLLPRTERIIEFEVRFLVELNRAARPLS